MTTYSHPVLQQHIGDPMFQRFQKPGGFRNFLKLLESVDKNKQDEFLNIASEQDPRWAQRAKERLLTIEQVFKFPEPVLSLILEPFDARILTCALKSTSKETAQRVLKEVFTKKQVEAIREHFSNSFSDEEKKAAGSRIILRVRELDEEKEISLAKIDPKISAEDPPDERSLVPYILVVDPDEFSRGMVSQVLERQNIFEATSAEEALNVIKFKYDYRLKAVFCSTELSDMTGFDLLGELREMKAFKSLPIVLLTNEIDTNKSRSAQMLKATDLLKKPIDKKQVLKYAA